MTSKRQVAVSILTSAIASLWLASCAPSDEPNAGLNKNDDELYADGGVADEDEASLEKASQTSSCYKAIGQKPSSVDTRWPDTYTFTRYLRVDKYNMHIVGTAHVSDWMMRETCLFHERVVSALKNSEDRDKMSGFVAHIATFKDDPLSNGNRNASSYLMTLLSEDMVCGVSPRDPYDPSRKRIYRDWNVASHEMGHAVENTLGLKARSARIYRANESNYRSNVANEYFAWGTENWLSEDRADMPQWERTYFSSVFNADNTWRPKCTR